LIPSSSPVVITTTAALSLSSTASIPSSTPSTSTSSSSSSVIIATTASLSSSSTASPSSSSTATPSSSSTASPSSSSTASPSSSSLASTTSILTTLSSTCQNAAGLDYACSYFSSPEFGFCNDATAYIKGILFSIACKKSCGLCPNQTTTLAPVTQISPSDCTDTLSYCSFWASYCFLLADQQPHPCRKTCKLCA